MMHRRAAKSGWLFTLLVISISGTGFATLGGLAHGISMSTCVLFACGALIGAMLVPDLKPESFRFPKTWQISMGAIGFALGAAYFHVPIQGILLAAILGTVFGYVVPYWFRHG